MGGLSNGEFWIMQVSRSGVHTHIYIYISIFDSTRLTHFRKKRGWPCRDWLLNGRTRLLLGPWTSSREDASELQAAQCIFDYPGNHSALVWMARIQWGIGFWSKSSSYHGLL